MTHTHRLAYILAHLHTHTCTQSAPITIAITHCNGILATTAAARAESSRRGVLCASLELLLLLPACQTHLMVFSRLTMHFVVAAVVVAVVAAAAAAELS